MIIISNDACMTFLTENIPLGNPWEGGYDVSRQINISTFDCLNGIFPDRSLSLHSPEHGEL